MNLLKIARDFMFPGLILKPGVAGYTGLPFMIILAIYNFRNYDKKLEEFNNRWDFESQDARLIKGVLIILFVVLPFIPLIFFDHSPHLHFH